VRFYLVAMIFVIFDIEIVFLYPFAVMFRQLALFGLVEFASFALVVFIAFAYLVSEGALDWARASASVTAAAPRHSHPQRHCAQGRPAGRPRQPHLRPHGRDSYRRDNSSLHYSHRHRPGQGRQLMGLEDLRHNFSPGPSKR